MATSGFDIGRLWRRELAGYPTGGYRIFLLAIVVLANIVFTWTVAAGTAATPVMFVHFGMTLNYYADLLVVPASAAAWPPTSPASATSGAGPTWW